MRYFIAAILICLAYSATAQLKYDANWVFGRNIQLKFQQDTVLVDSARCINSESSASISDPLTGELLFYLSDTNGNNYFRSKVFDKDNQEIDNNSDLRHCSTCTNGALILPMGNDRSYMILHIGYEGNVCFNDTCRFLYHSKVKVDDFGTPQIVYANRKAFNENVDERLTAVKHANDKDWWIYTHQSWASNPNECSRLFYNFLLQEDSLRLNDTIEIGTNQCGVFSAIGEFSVSHMGDKLAVSNVGQDAIDIYDIDRCSGMLSNSTSINTGIIDPYGLSFSPNGSKLYVTGQTPNDLTVVTNGTSTRLLTSLEPLGQLQFAPNGNIYVAIQGKNKLGIINNPDSNYTAQTFTMDTIYLDQGMYSTYSLPNYPNYNLGPLPVFTATAGGDTVQCVSGSGVTLGVPSVTNMLYQWSPANTLNRTNIAQPIATPTEDTWYYLITTDTTATSCAVATDSVLVQVVNCVGIEETPLSQITLYPNPATDQLYINLPDNIPTAQLELYSLLGAELLQSPVHDKTPIDISQLPKGMYVYRLRVNGLYHTGKLVVE